MRTTEGDPIDRETKQPESYLTGQPRDGSSAARTQVMRGHEVSSTMGFKTKVAWGRKSETATPCMSASLHAICLPLPKAAHFHVMQRRGPQP